jgi:hypothetical protein
MRPQKIAGCSITRWLSILGGRPPVRGGSRTVKEPSMHSNSKLVEWIVGLVAAAISIDVLATELPHVLPYLVVLAVIYIIIHLIVYHTNKW